MQNWPIQAQKENLFSFNLREIAKSYYFLVQLTAFEEYSLDQNPFFVKYSPLFIFLSNIFLKKITNAFINKWEQYIASLYFAEEGGDCRCNTWLMRWSREVYDICKNNPFGMRDEMEPDRGEWRKQRFRRQRYVEHSGPLNTKKKRVICRSPLIH